jgi:hypothetical protein
MTTGSLVAGTVQGMGLGLDNPTGQVTHLIDGTPNGVVEVAVGSEVAYDSTNGQYYMGLTGTTWVKLGSVA